MDVNKLVTANVYCDSVFDGTHETPKPVNKGKLLITSKHISGGTLDVSTAYMISNEDYDSIQKRSAVAQWDVLFSMIGSVGEVYIEKSEHIPYAIKNMGVFSCKDKHKAKWLYYFLLSPAAKSHINRYLNGAVQKFLPLGALRNFPVIPFCDEKRKLVKVLESLDAKIELNNRINTELEAMAKTLYDYWFVQFDFPDQNGKPYKSSGGKMVYNDTLKREIPEEWLVTSLPNCCDIVDCLHSKKSEFFYLEEKYYLLQLENIRDDSLVDITNKYYVSKKDYEKWTARIEVKAGDVVITNAGRVAAFAQIPSNVITGLGRNITAIRPASISPNYFFLSLSGVDIQRQIASNLDHGAFFMSFNVKGIKKLSVLRPPVFMEKGFEAKVSPVCEKRHHLIVENQQLTQLRDWLLPMLMNGQVTVA